MMNQKTYPSEVCSPSGCCSRKGYGHPQAVYPQRSNVVDQEGYPPYPESLP